MIACNIDANQLAKLIGRVTQLNNKDTGDKIKLPILSKLVYDKVYKLTTETKNGDKADLFALSYVKFIPPVLLKLRALDTNKFNQYNNITKKDIDDLEKAFTNKTGDLTSVKKYIEGLAIPINETDDEEPTIPDEFDNFIDPTIVDFDPVPIGEAPKESQDLYDSNPYPQIGDSLPVITPPQPNILLGATLLMQPSSNQNISITAYTGLPDEIKAVTNLEEVLFRSNSVVKLALYKKLARMIIRPVFNSSVDEYSTVLVENINNAAREVVETLNFDNILSTITEATTIEAIDKYTNYLIKNHLDIIIKSNIFPSLSSIIKVTKINDTLNITIDTTIQSNNYEDSDLKDAIQSSSKLVNLWYSTLENPVQPVKILQLVKDKYKNIIEPLILSDPIEILEYILTRQLSDNEKSIVNEVLGEFKALKALDHSSAINFYAALSVSFSMSLIDLGSVENGSLVIRSEVTNQSAAASSIASNTLANVKRIRSDKDLNQTNNKSYLIEVDINDKSADMWLIPDLDSVFKGIAWVNNSYKLIGIENGKYKVMEVISVEIDVVAAFKAKETELIVDMLLVMFNINNSDSKDKFKKSLLENPIRPVTLDELGNFIFKSNLNLLQNKTFNNSTISNHINRITLLQSEFFTMKNVVRSVKGTQRGLASNFNPSNAFAETLRIAKSEQGVAIRGSIFEKELNVRMIVRDGVEMFGNKTTQTQYTPLDIAYHDINYSYFANLKAHNRTKSAFLSFVYSDASTEYEQLITRSSDFVDGFKPEAIETAKANYLKFKNNYYQNVANQIFEDFTKAYINYLAENDLLDERNMPNIDSFAKIDKLFQDYDNDVIGNMFYDSDIPYIKDYHYSEKNGVKKFNKNFVDAYNKKDSLSPEILKETAKYLDEIGFTFDYNAKAVADIILDAFEVDNNLHSPSITKILSDSSEVDASKAYSVYDKNGNINPLLEKWLYEHLLVNFSFNNLLIGNASFFKGKDEAFSVIERFKRSKSLVSSHSNYEETSLGLSNITKVAIINDPVAIINSLTQGDTFDYNPYDGASFTSEIEIIEKANGLGGFFGVNTGLHHKSVGLSHDYKRGTTSFNKHNDFAITSEMIRTSKGNDVDWGVIHNKLLSTVELSIIVETGVTMLSYINGALVTNKIDDGRLFNKMSELYNALGGAYTVTEDLVGPIRINGKRYRYTNLQQDKLSHPSNYIVTMMSEKWKKAERGVINKFENLNGEETVKLLKEIRDDVSFPKDILEAIEVYTNEVEDTTLKIDSSSVIKKVANYLGKVGSTKGQHLLSLSLSTAFKNNEVNSNKGFDSDFYKYMMIDNRQKGVQIDASKSVDQAEVTVPSQLLSAILLDTKWGTSSDKALDIISQLAVLELSDEIKNVSNENLDPIEKQKLMDFLEKNLKDVLIQNLNTDIQGLVSYIFQQVGISVDSQMINSIFVASFSSLLTSKGIKSKIKGVKQILKPAIQVYQDANGVIKLGDEVLSSEPTVFISSSSDLNTIDKKFIRSIVTTYTKYDITYLDDNGTEVTEVISFQTFNDASFKKLEGLVINKKIIELKVDHTKPRDLKPSEFFYYEDGIKYDIFEKQNLVDSSLKGVDKLDANLKNRALLTQQVEDIYKEATSIETTLLGVNGFKIVNNQKVLVWSTTFGELISSNTVAKEFGLPPNMSLSSISVETFQTSRYTEAAAILIYADFIKAQQALTARTPLESLASIMASRVVAFIHTEENTMMVNKKHQFLTGGDFDVDTSSFMTFFIHDSRIVTKELAGRDKQLQKKALLNQLLETFMDIYNDPRSKLISESGINMDEIKELSDEFQDPKFKRSLTSENPVSRWFIKYANMVGKDVIGISAVGIKTLAAIVNSYRLDVQEYARTTSDKILERMKVSIDIKNEKDEVIILPSNTDLSPIKDKTKIDQFKVRALISPGAVILGNFLNGSVDNAKYLYLSDLDCDISTAGIFTASATLGISRRDIVRLLKDPSIKAFNNSIKPKAFSSNKRLYIFTELTNKLTLLDPASEEYQKFKKYETLLLIAKEFKALSKVLGINKSLKSTTYEYYKFEEDLSSQILGNFYLNKGKLTKEESIEIKRWASNFNLNEFISDSVYRESSIDNYNKIKTAYNILNIIANNAHTMSMLEVYRFSSLALSNVSLKIKSIGKLLSNLKKERLISSINEITFNKIFRLMDSFAIDAYFKSEKFTSKHPDLKLSTSKERDLFVASFITKFNTFKVNMPNNEFLYYVLEDMTKKDYLDKSYPMLSLLFDPTNNTSDATLILNSSIKQGLKELESASLRLKDGTIIKGSDFIRELRFYNLLVNSDSFGKSSFSRYYNPTILGEALTDFIAFQSSDEANDAINNVMMNLKDNEIRVAISAELGKDGLLETQYVGDYDDFFGLDYTSLIDEESEKPKPSIITKSSSGVQLSVNEANYDFNRFPDYKSLQRSKTETEVILTVPSSYNIDFKDLPDC